MGYDLHITRRNDHSDAEGPEITEAEWRSLVARDHELKFENPPDQWLSATWTGESRQPVLGAFHHYDGCVVAKNPDPPTVAKMLRLAAELDGKVQGDDGEFYLTPHKTYYEESGDEPWPTRPWWRRLFGA